MNSYIKNREGKQQKGTQENKLQLGYILVNGLVTMTIQPQLKKPPIQIIWKWLHVNHV